MNEAKEISTGWLSRLKQGLKLSSTKLNKSISGIFTKRKLNQEMLDLFEETLIKSDFGIETAEQIIATLKQQRFDQDITLEEVQNCLVQEITEILSPLSQPLIIPNINKPYVILVIGVNGSGKTTTIGKLARYYQKQGKKVYLAAADTFRAAAVAQLKMWAQCTDVPIHIGKEHSEPASVAFEALQNAQKQSSDILLIDTAGRLHNNENLMAELSKIQRVLKKIDSDSPHSCILVLDATIGQNAHNQIELFSKIVNLSGIIMTKLDGTARGGVLIAIAKRFKIPIHAIGVGESEDDLRPFDASTFARSLLGIDNDINT